MDGTDPNHVVRLQHSYGIRVPLEWQIAALAALVILLITVLILLAILLRRRR